MAAIHLYGEVFVLAIVGAQVMIVVLMLVWGFCCTCRQYICHCVRVFCVMESDGKTSALGPEVNRVGSPGVPLPYS